MVQEEKISIIDAYPAEEARLVKKIALDIEYDDIRNMFLRDDRLVIFYYGEREEETIPEYDYVPRISRIPVTYAILVDVSDPESPSMLAEYSIDGYFMDARMIGDHAYFVTNMDVDEDDPRFPVIIDGRTTRITPDAFYFDAVQRLTNFNTLAAVNVAEGTIVSETFLMGDSGTFYVSKDNFYLTYAQDTYIGYGDDRQKFFKVIVPLFPEDVQEQIRRIQEEEAGASRQWELISDLLEEAYNRMDGDARDELFNEIDYALDLHDSRAEFREETVIHKISIDGADIEYVAKGSVPGRLLNQFSMDESNDRFRIATITDGARDGWQVRANSVYVLDEQLEIVGGLDGIAENESIYAARFIDDRLYLVTFRQIDPFFVIDLSSDKPEVLGELKMPGFSNYLHPFDRDHVIGIGRDGTDTGRILGIKIALFDVSDVDRPEIADEVIIGGHSTYSPAEHDHRAFFFDKPRGVLSVPIMGDAGELADTKGSGASRSLWTGFYVFDIDARDGLSLRGTISHNSEQHGSADIDAARTFYIEDVLYTVSWEHLRMNSFDDLEAINSISLENTGGLVEFLD